MPDLLPIESIYNEEWTREKARWDFRAQQEAPAKKKKDHTQKQMLVVYFFVSQFMIWMTWRFFNALAGSF